MNNKEKSWDDFYTEVFACAMTIIKDNNCITFKLLGYKYNNMRLILHFNDCNQVFDFVKLSNEIKVTKFFTNDHIDTHICAKHEVLHNFEKELDIDQPENK